MQLPQPTPPFPRKLSTPGVSSARPQLSLMVTVISSGNQALSQEGPEGSHQRGLPPGMRSGGPGAM